jgi:hypothetical protein
VASAETWRKIALHLPPNAPSGPRLKPMKSALITLATIGGVFLLAPGAGATPTASALTSPVKRPPIKPGDLTKLNGQMGSQLILNGRSQPIAWSLWQTTQGNRIFLSEIGLTQLLGIQLLSTSDPSQQPIAWFSEPEREIARLPVKIVGTQRHFDITDLAKLAGWAIDAKEGGPLTLATPSAKVTAMQVTPEAWGDRITIALDAPVPYEWDAQSQEFVLSLAAPIDPAIAQPWQYTPPIAPPPAPTTEPLQRPLPSPPSDRPQLWSGLNRASSSALAPTSTPTPSLTPTPSPAPSPAPAPPSPYRRLKSLQVETVGQRSTLRLGLPITLRPRITMLSNPPQLVIDVGNPALPSRDIAWTEGLRWQQRLINGFPVNWLELDPKQSRLAIQPVLPGVALANVMQTAQQKGAIAAINGGFFNRNNQLPLGAIRLDRAWLSGPILTRGVVAWNPGGDWRFERLVSQEAVTVAGQKMPLTTVNSAYLQAGIARYTPEWGLAYSSMTNGEVVVTVQDGRVIDQTMAETPGTVVSIPANAYLLVFRSNKTAAAKFPIATPVQLESAIVPNVDSYQSVIGGGPLLIKDSQIVLNAASEQFSPAFVNELAARSAIGQTLTGKILIVAAQNSPTSRGPTLGEIAQIMQQLGAVNALNLDGGSSTTLYLGGQIVDRAPRSSARVHNVIGVFLK